MKIKRPPTISDQSIIKEKDSKEENGDLEMQKEKLRQKNKKLLIKLNQKIIIQIRL